MLHFTEQKLCKKRHFFETDSNNYSIDAFEISKKISPTGVFIKSNFFWIMENSNLLSKRSEKSFIVLFNRDLNRGCLFYMFSLRFSGSKFLIILRR